jgi:UDP-N-acetylglucosamine 2-epimerase (non-hydrolysing)
MKTVLVVLGTRPEAIKLAPVIAALKRQPQTFQAVVCVTAQHRQMLDQVLRLFQVCPDIDLDLMQENQSLSGLTSRVMLRVTDAITEVAPDVVLVQGDTTTAMVSALAAFYLRIPVGHVEAGLRTRDPYNPFPEEMNRRLISVLGTVHFAPTKKAFEALVGEGVPEEQVFLTGNTVVDALLAIAHQSDAVDIGLPLDGRKVILVTAHRRESFGEPLHNICLALGELARRHPEVLIVYPVHPNPNVREPVRRLLSGRKGIALLEPLEYKAFVYLMKHAYFILTDSGGIQEEAPALGKPVLVLRDETERPEGIEAGTAKLVGTCTEAILAEAEQLLLDCASYVQMACAVSPYGDGKAADRIVEILKTL